MGSGILCSILFGLLVLQYSRAEFVPVYMWETAKSTHKIPAIGPVNAETFKEFLLSKITHSNPCMVVFTEQNLSPEDFIEQDRTIFKHLSKIEDDVTLTYSPLVEDPINVFKQLSKQFKEISVNDFQPSMLTCDQILLINLNDAKDEEDRMDMLQRHDAKVSEIYKSILKAKKGLNIMAVFTGIHSSWIVPEEIKHHISTRAADDTGTKLTADSFLMHFINDIVYKDGDKEPELIKLDTATRADNEVSLKHLLQEVMLLNFTTHMGYWFLESITMNGKNIKFQMDKHVYAPEDFSYHCSDRVFTYVEKDKEVIKTLTIKEFQVQIQIANRTALNAFGDAYDCVGFTSAPIWSGLFITFILALIMTLGLTMMMDIKTMDRFDDPKGKTIIINASE